MNALHTTFLEQGTSRQVDARQLLLHAGDVAQRLYLIEQGCARLYLVEGAAIKARAKTDPALQAELQVLTQQRLIHYANLYTSAIADSPTQRYLALQATHQQRLERIPLHILAAYLGVSAVHLSRIRRKLKDTPPVRAL